MDAPLVWLKLNQNSLLLVELSQPDNVITKSNFSVCKHYPSLAKLFSESNETEAAGITTLILNNATATSVTQ